jgi:hypothetical protein
LFFNEPNKKPTLRENPEKSAMAQRYAGLSAAQVSYLYLCEQQREYLATPGTADCERCTALRLMQPFELGCVGLVMTELTFDHCLLR